MKKKSLLLLIDLIKYPLITEKTMKLLELNQYTFIVDRNSNKNDIKEAISLLFSVKVENVNILRQPLKTKRLKSGFGMKTIYKKAIVHLSDKDKIDFFDDEILQKK